MGTRWVSAVAPWCLDWSSHRSMPLPANKPVMVASWGLGTERVVGCDTLNGVYAISPVINRIIDGVFMGFSWGSVRFPSLLKRQCL